MPMLARCSSLQDEGEPPQSASCVRNETAVALSNRYYNRLSIFYWYFACLGHCGMVFAHTIKSRRASSSNNNNYYYCCYKKW